MAHVLNTITLNQANIDLLRKTMQSPPSIDTRIKAECLLHLNQTQDIAYTADQFFIQSETLKAWVRAWQDDGLDGLDEQDTSDTPYSDLAYKHYLAEILEEYPDTYGVDADEWTVELLMEYMEQTTDRDLGIEAFMEMMHAVGW